MKFQIRSVLAWNVLLVAVTSAGLSFAQAPKAEQIARWEQQAKRITITRDDWGIAHVHGKTDADAVFGMEYTQAEDDFNRVETNYLNSLGWLAQSEGEGKIYQDLRQRLFIDPVELKKEYAASPAWLKALMDSFADGLNFYLYKHPEVKPLVITKFEPWMALSFTEGSIGGDIERVNLTQLEAFYGKGPGKEMAAAVDPNWFMDELEKEPSGSNGMAISPTNTKGKHALLLINPHTSFFFRSELQMASDEGLNAYGAATWGQFFIYQGFNAHAGWMHTSSGVDAVDEYLETVTKKGDGYLYKYGDKELPVTAKMVTVKYKANGGMAEKKFTVYYTQHGPVTREMNGKWVTIRLMQEHIKALEQSYLRTKATDYKSFRETMELKGNSSNNTIFADDKGNIAYFHGNYIPKRDTKFDWTKPVDGSDPATDYKGLMTVAELPQLLNPKSGWLYNSNNSPWSGAGESSLKKADFPAYVEMGTESARGLHAVRVLTGKKNFTVDSLIGAAYDSYLPWFDMPLPALVKAWNGMADSNPLKAKVAAQVAMLKGWDQRWAVNSVPTSLGVFWGEEMRRRVAADARKAGVSVEDYLATTESGEQLVDGLAVALDKLTADFGKWEIPWGDINRFQRLTGDIVQPFSDAAPSIPVGFTSAVWGSLASFGARPYAGTKKWYGTSGNSFVAVVEFGDKVRARAVTAGGESGHVGSPHFNDEAKRYSTGELRDVYYYAADLKGHVEKEYQPGR